MARPSQCGKQQPSVPQPTKQGRVDDGPESAMLGLKEENKNGASAVAFYNCDVCDAKFRSKGGMNGHKVTKHKRNQGFECQICEQKFVRKDVLANHIRNIHEKVRFDCKHCDAKLNSMQSLIRHVKTLHQNPDTIKCPICQEELDRKIFLKRHIIKTHVTALDPGRFECSVCLKIFKAEDQTYQHIKVQHESPQLKKCEMCEKEFYSTSTMRSHFKIVHEKKLDYECEICNKKFGTKNSLVKHSQRIHVEALDVAFKNSTKMHSIK